MHGNRSNRTGGALLVCLLLGWGGGCRTPPVDQARNDFYAGRFTQAEQHLETIPENNKDEVLFLMERGMIRHALHAYDPSSDDWRRAAERNAWLETYSISQGATSLVSNDRVLAFRGAPFEMTLLYSFLAKNYLIQQNWDFAAISARNIIRLLEGRDGFPEVPYGRYMAGFCLALINDTGNAATQYRAINEIFEHDLIDPETGRRPGTEARLPGAPPPPELVVFLAMGRMPTPQVAEYQADGVPPHIEIIIDDQHRDTAMFFD
ncbi:MAG: hypothetical protein LC725_03360, partial [Lentisphaerae bacterium]|nr:hypothetical protein [Lentisphaerota bacterium]